MAERDGAAMAAARRVGDVVVTGRPHTFAVAGVRCYDADPRDLPERRSRGRGEPMAKGQVKQSKNNKPKLTPKEKAAKKKAKEQAKGG